MKREARPAGPSPTAAQLREAALRHLARFSTTEAGLVRVLDRRIDRWARRAMEEGAEVAGAVASARAEGRRVAQALVAEGMIDDAAFAAARARRLTRAGRSRRAVASHLASKGLEGAVVADVLPDPEQEFSAALSYTRRRRLGPFRAAPDASAIQRELATMGRAGFSRDIAERALAMPFDEAEALVLALKRG